MFHKMFNISHIELTRISEFVSKEQFYEKENLNFKTHEFSIFKGCAV